jgi:hypothetical protein
MFLGHPHHILDISCWRWTIPPLEISIKQEMPFFKFKQNTIVITFTVKAPLPTCKIRYLFNLPHGEFLLSPTSSAFMQRKIVSFSAPPRETAPKEIAAKPVPKSENLYSTKQFTHDPTVLASHRDDRIFRSKQIWIQGLPTDPTQAMNIVKHIGTELRLSISEESVASVGDLFAALNGKPSQGTSPPMIGSTANSHATVVNLENMATFSAVPKPGYISTVTELVIHTTSADHQEAYTTIVIVPWLLATTSDLTLIMRFHHMGMDAKSELIHAIYHQLIAISDKHGHPVKQIQFIARIVTADKPLWVIDLIGPFGFSAIHLNHHFTGNSAGSSETVEFDGIPTQVLGGYGISNAPLPGYSHPPLSWAILPTALDLPLR